MSPSFLDELAAVDAELAAHGRIRRSLAPEREIATPLADLGRRVRDEIPGLDDAALSQLAQGLGELLRAIRESFPDNIFGDLDYVVASLAADAVASGDPRRHLEEQLRLATDLHRLFGRHSPIRFQYVHDFIYGFDWAKWVRSEPARRRHHGPFSPAFLVHMKGRGHELLELINADDEKYHRLADDATPRNPFGFSREPEAEMAIHRDLVRLDLIPVPTWRFDAESRWDRDFVTLRRERAQALGYGR